MSFQRGEEWLEGATSGKGEVFRMWVRASGSLGENIAQVTTAVSSHLLVVGDKQAGVVDGALGIVAHRLVEEITAALGAGRTLDYLFLTHHHFDHIGGIPVLRRVFPKLQVVAGPLCSEQLAKSETVEQAFRRNGECCNAVGSSWDVSLEEFAQAVTVDLVVGDSDSILLGGGVEVKAVACPGHTEDSFAFYVRPDAALAIGEAAGGFHGRGKMSVSFCSSLNSYLASIDKLGKLELRFISFPHSGTIAGAQATTYLTAARSAAEALALSIKERLDEGALVDEVSANLYPELLEEKIYPDGAVVSATRELLENMVRVVAAGK